MIARRAESEEAGVGDAQLLSRSKKEYRYVLRWVL